MEPDNQKQAEGCHDGPPLDVTQDDEEEQEADQ